MLRKHSRICVLIHVVSNLTTFNLPTFNLQPSTFQPSTFQPSNLPTFQPSNLQPSAFNLPTFQPSNLQLSTYQRQKQPHQITLSFELVKLEVAPPRAKKMLTNL